MTSYTENNGEETLHTPNNAHTRVNTDGSISYDTYIIKVKSSHSTVDCNDCSSSDDVVSTVDSDNEKKKVEEETRDTHKVNESKESKESHHEISIQETLVLCLGFWN
jgi:hypothetical protein